jgi:hypothetical protein
MAVVTYFLALPVVAADDGIAAGEPTECLNRCGFSNRARGAVEPLTSMRQKICRENLDTETTLKSCCLTRRAEIGFRLKTIN